MGKPIARIGDVHKGICNHGLDCCPHSVTGTIVQGSPDVFNNGKNVARNGDHVVHNCPHCGTGYIVSSSTVKVNGISIAHLGDTVIYPGGSGTIVSSSHDTNAQ